MNIANKYIRLLNEFRLFLIRQKFIFLLVFISYIAGVMIVFILPQSAKLYFFIPLVNKMVDISKTYSLIFNGILISNLISTGYLVLSGILFFLPFLFIFVNGISMGLVIDYSSKMSIITGQNLFTMTMVSIIPHGIIEIPLMMFTAVISVIFGLKLLLPKKIEPNIPKMVVLKMLMKYLLFIVIPFIILAAFLEAFITPLLSDTFKIKEKTEHTKQMVTSEDLKQLGLYPGIPKNNTIDICSQTIFKLSLVQIADKNYLEKYKTGNQSDSQNFIFGANSTAYVFVRQSQTGHESYISLMSSVFTELGKIDPSVNFQFNDNTVTVKTNNESCVMKIGVWQGYAYLIASNNMTDTDFDNLVQIQLSKLQNTKNSTQ